MISLGAGKKTFTYLGFLISLAASIPLFAANVLIIGDSLSKEYEYEGFFIGGDNTDERNWAETLQSRRNSFFNMGSEGFRSDVVRAPYGHKYNWSRPGSLAEEWANTYLATSGLSSVRSSIRSQLINEVDRVVVWLGGNDAKSQYGSIYNGSSSASWVSSMQTNFTKILDFVSDSAITTSRASLGKAPLQIVVVGVPHVGCTPTVYETYPNSDTPSDIAAVRTQRVTSAIEQINNHIKNYAQAKSFAYADIYEITKKLLVANLNQKKWVIGGYTLKVVNPVSDGLALFLNDNFHPSTSTQAIFAQYIVDAFNSKYGSQIPRVKNREINLNFMGIMSTQINNQGLNSFLAAYDFAAAALDPNADPDGDGISNVLEYAFDNNPHVSDVTFHPQAYLVQQTSNRTLNMNWQPRDASNSTFLKIQVEESTDLLNWTQLSAAQIATLDSASNTVGVQRSASSTRLFLRFKVLTL